MSALHTHQRFAIIDTRYSGLNVEAFDDLESLIVSAATRMHRSGEGASVPTMLRALADAIEADDAADD